MTTSEHTRAHRLRLMAGRDPHEQHRSVTPLELLYDLTFVVAFGQASSEFAHLLAEGHYSAGLIGFGFSTFGICWAWITSRGSHGTTATLTSCASGSTGGPASSRRT